MPSDLTVEFPPDLAPEPPATDLGESSGESSLGEAGLPEAADFPETTNLPGATELARKIEAILYLKAQPLSLAAIAEHAGCDRKTAESALRELLADYAHRNTALEIVETKSVYSLQLKETYQDLVKSLVPVDLGVGAMRTLATIAIRGPIPQTELVDYRGSGAYDHVKDLVERGFVAKRRQANGRSFSLQVTEQFYQYFQLEGIPELQLTAKAQRRRQAQADAEAVTSPEAQQLDLPDPTEESIAAETGGNTHEDAIGDAHGNTGDRTNASESILDQDIAPDMSLDIAPEPPPDLETTSTLTASSPPPPEVVAEATVEDPA